MRESDDELAEAALHVGEISRAGCRAWVEQHFDVRQMTRRYLNVYQAALNERQSPLAPDMLASSHTVAPMANNLLVEVESEQANP